MNVQRRSRFGGNLKNLLGNFFLAPAMSSNLGSFFGRPTQTDLLKVLGGLSLRRSAPVLAAWRIRRESDSFESEAPSMYRTFYLSCTCQTGADRVICVFQT